MATKTVKTVIFDAPNGEKIPIEVDPLTWEANQRTRAANDANAAAGQAELNRINNAGSAAKAGYGGGSEIPPEPEKVVNND